MSTWRDTLRIYYQFSKKRKAGMLTPLLIAPFAIASNQILPPIVVALILERLTEDNIVFGDFAWLIIAFVFLRFIATEFLWRLLIHIMNRSEMKVATDLTLYTFSDLANRDMSFHANNFAGALVTKVKRFVGSFTILYDTLVFDVVTTATIVIFTFIYLSIVLPWVAVVLLITSIPIIWAMFKFGEKRAYYNRIRAEAESNTTAQIADMITNVAAVKSFGREKYEINRFRHTAEHFEKAKIRAWDYQNIPVDLFSGISTSLIHTIALIGSIIAVVNGYSNIGVVFITINLVGNVSRRLWELNRIFRTVEQAMSDAVEMTDILNVDHVIVDDDGAKDVKFKKGQIEMNDVSFAYNDNKKNEKLFSSFNLEIPAGQKVGLVGPSGSGKTSLSKLLLRYNDIQNGEILIDGHDISKIQQTTLRQHISYVPQEPLLFHRTIFENIQYGRLNASKDEVIEAARKARVHEFVQKLPDGYETLVGERGVKLSGGQRQRVALARAILKNSPVFILDEATSSLDSESEKYIQEALDETMKKRTSIVIAHRLSTIKKLDRIIVMAEGEIVEDGTHNELIELNGLYANLWSHQTGGLIED